MLGFILVVVWLSVAGGSLLWGLAYYLLPLGERAFSPMAAWFAPTGLVGQGFGVVGTGMILVGVVGYTARKRLAFLARFGSLRQWLQVHIFLCTLGPWLVLLHTTFKFGGIVSVAFWSMALVVASGVFGRYLYVRIPKTVNGRFLGMEAVAERIGEVGRALRARSGLPEAELEAALAVPLPAVAPRGLASSLALAVAEDVRGRARQRKVRGLLRSHGVPARDRRELLRLAREQGRLRQQVLLLRPFQRLFRYWHVFHLPLAIVMFLILAVHVGVAVLFGYTWVF